MRNPFRPVIHVNSGQQDALLRQVLDLTRDVSRLQVEQARLVSAFEQHTHRVTILMSPAGSQREEVTHEPTKGWTR